MTTRSIERGIVIKDKKAAKRLVEALEEAERKALEESQKRKESKVKEDV